MEFPELEKRIRALENAQSGIEQTFKQIAVDLHEIKGDIKEFLQSKPKLDGVDVLFKKNEAVDIRVQKLELELRGLTTEHTGCKKEQSDRDVILEGLVKTVNTLITNVNTISTEHNTCKRVQESGINFILGRAGTVLDWLFKAGILTAVGYMLQKGVHP